jgi:hypothetical protein
MPPVNPAPPPPNSKLGLYGKGSYDVTKARADVKKALEDAAKSLSKTKAYNCTIQPQPRKPQSNPASPAPPAKGLAGLQKAAVEAAAKKGGQKDDHAQSSTINRPPSTTD